MKISDLLKLSLTNLLRRKMRTVLTVLGVVIGTASIVVMVSLGIGMSRALIGSFADNGSLTTITVMSDMNSTKQDTELTDGHIEAFRRIPHVTGVSGDLSVSFSAVCGNAKNDYISLHGVSQDYLKGIKLEPGSTIPGPGEEPMKLIFGNAVGSNFYVGNDWNNPKTINPRKDTVFYTFPEPDSSMKNQVTVTGGDGSSEDSGGDTDGMDSGTRQNPAKKYILECCGVTEGGSDTYSQYSFNCYTDIDTLKNFLKKIYKKNLVPSPRTNKNGKPIRYYVYDEAFVMVDEYRNVQAVQKTLNEMGYQATSDAEMLESVKQTMNIVQLVLGGIGGVALLVAAIGIMNTMMMSIYERTKEIGIMKVLGCDMRDIRNMFLSESAMIGFFGGVIGILFSFLVSFIINTLASRGVASSFLGLGSDNLSISVIPLWLIAGAIGFAILIGTVSGYVPAVRAMKLSPLKAIQNE